VEQVIHKDKYVDQYFEVNESGNTKLHIYLGDQKISTIENEQEIYFNLNDHLDSTAIITNETGQVVEINDYEDFGGIINQSSAISNYYKFGGKELDSETSLQYFGARYYDSDTARFVSIDPLLISSPNSFLTDPQQLNSYSYARNNPVRFIDPTGNFSISSIWNSFVDSISFFTSRIFNKPNITNQAQTVVSTPNHSGGQTGNNSIQNDATWDAVSNERIKQLDTRVQQPAINFINDTEAQFDIQLRVTQGYRSIEYQNELYWQSRTSPPTGPWVTNAKGGQSYHNYGRAIDVVVMEGGQPKWEPISQDIANIAIDQGFEWGGNWTAPYMDYPHFQMTFGESWQDLYNSHNQ
jgi:RHS repeat-associated protein